MPRDYTRRPLIDRVMDRVVKTEDGHWIWTGSVGSSGYGKIRDGGRRGPDLLVHRVVWEHHNGSIPAGLVLDHTDRCLQILCCKPACLEPVTQAENRRRQAARRTHCNAGHEYTPENTRVGNNGRECRICHADRARLARARRRNADYDTRCRNGHLRTPENTWRQASGALVCRDCMSAAATERWRRHRDTAFLDSGS
jgi:hypothetical protein